MFPANPHRPADEHGRSAAAEDGATGTGAERGTAHGSDASAAAAGLTGGDTQGDACGKQDRAGRCCTSLLVSMAISPLPR